MVPAIYNDPPFILAGFFYLAPLVVLNVLDDPPRKNDKVNLNLSSLNQSQVNFNKHCIRISPAGVNVFDKH